MSLGSVAVAVALLTTCWAGEAHAAEETVPLMLYAGSSHKAQLRVRRATEEAAAGVDARTLPDLVSGGDPYFVGPVQSATCAGPATTNEIVLRKVVDAHELRVNMNLDGAAAALDEASQSLGCLGQPLEPSTGARVHFLRGILHFAQGDEAAARVAFAAAIRFRPDLPWDEDFAPDARPLFALVQAAAAALPRTKLRLVAGTAQQLRIDGRVPVIADGVIEIAAGAHTIQVTGETVHTLEVDLPADPPIWLVIPSAVDDALLDAVLTPQGRDALAGLIHGATGKDRRVVLVAHSAGTWRYAVAEQTWQRLRVDVGRSLRTPLLIGGGTAIGLGGVLMAVHGSKANKLASGVESDQAGDNPRLDTAAHRDRQAQWKRTRTGYWLGTGIGATGVVAATIGGVLFLDGSKTPFQLVPSALPGGGMLHLQWSSGGAR